MAERPQPKAEAQPRQAPSSASGPQGLHQPRTLEGPGPLSPVLAGMADAVGGPFLDEQGGSWDLRLHSLPAAALAAALAQV